MERESGYLCLNKYYDDLKEKKHCQYYNLIAEGYIRPSDYDDRHFWLNIEGETYYYKPSNYAYHEILGYYIAKELGFNASYCDLAKFSIVPSEAENNKGIISKSYRKENCKYIPGYEILKEYYEAHPEVVIDMGLTNGWKKFYEGPYYIDMNNLEIIWQALEYKYNSNPKVEILKLVYQIVERYIYAILIRANDKGAQNWEVEESADGVSICPITDNELIFYPRATTTMSTGFEDSEKSIGKSIYEFLTTSSCEFMELFIEKFNKFDLDALMKCINLTEQQIGECIPDEIKKEILYSFKLNQRQINFILKNLDLQSKGR